MQSTIQQRGTVTFPEYTGERVYMREFYKHAGLPADLQRWQATVDAMLDGVDTDGPIYLMIDQALVPATATHRRPGLHVDGCWNPKPHAHGHCLDSDEIETLILASDVLGCAAYVGEYHDSPAEGGCCAHIERSNLTRVDLEPGRVWAGPALTLLHEALPLLTARRRTVVRLNVKGWEH